MKLTVNFSLEELTHSDIAVRAGIDNAPPPELMSNLKRTAEAMEEVRQLLGGRPITVSSGYRGPEVNKLVGAYAPERIKVMLEAAVERAAEVEARERGLSVADVMAEAKLLLGV